MREQHHGEIEVALYLLNDSTQSMNLNLFSMIPQDAPYVKTFSISNNEGTSRTETSLEYDLQIITTTNLPLRYELYMHEEGEASNTTDIITSKVIEADEDGTYFQKIGTNTKSFGHTEDKTNIYDLVIYFDKQYKTIVDYQDIIESVELKIDSKQII